MDKNFTDVLKKLKEVADTKSTIEKVGLLKEFLKETTFRTVVKAALSPSYQYNIKDLPPFSANGGTSVEKIFKKLISLSKQKGASNRDKLDLAYHASINNATWEVVQRIVRKDLRCGANAKTVNKAYPNLVQEIPYCRCSSESKIDRISYPAIVQKKADGMFVNIILTSRTLFLTRNGRKIHQLGELKKEFLSFLSTNKGGVVLMGELLVFKNGKILPRETGNGILSQCLQGTAKQSDADCVITKIWDVVSLENFKKQSSPLPYLDRFQKISEITQIINSSKIEVIKTIKVNSLIEAREFYIKMREQKEEGAVLKDYTALWKFHTSPKQIKLKEEMDVELIITKVNTGAKGRKYENCLGTLTMESQCGKLIVDVGSGFSDRMRGYLPVSKDHSNAVPTNSSEENHSYIDGKSAEMALRYWEKQIGSIAQICCNSIIKDKRTNVHSCFLPRFVEPRIDKSEADTLSELLSR